VKDLLCGGFQEAVGTCLARHKSVLDVLTKLQESDARVSRSVAKAVTSCGCLSVHAQRQRIPSDASLAELRQFMDSHLDGALCEHCKEIVQAEIGGHLFYVAALCNLLGISLYDALLTEHKKIEALGIYNFT
jgi:hypothetical protein